MKLSVKLYWVSLNDPSIKSFKFKLGFDEFKSVEYKRVLKERGIVILFAQTPFDKVLGCSNLEWLRYEWIWEKTQATGHLNAKKMPMKAHENILIFSI